MMNRKDKLKKVKAQKKEEGTLPSAPGVSGGIQLQLERGAELEKAAIELKEVLEKGVDFNNLDKLLTQLSSISEVRGAVDGLREAIDAFPEIPEEVKIKGFNEFIGALKEINIAAPEVNLPAPIVKVQKDKSTNKILAQMAKAMAGFAGAIKANAPSAPSQRPADFVPYRRVIKDGNHYKFDDGPSGGGGGGGGLSGRGVPQATNASDQVFVPVANPDGSNISGGGGGGGGASTIADGADVAEGATTDAAVAAGAAGTVSAKLRRLTTDLDSIKTNTASNATTTKQDTGNTSLGNIDTSTAAINTVAGSKTDAKNTATDATSVSIVSILKQISASAQAPPSQAVTNAGIFAVQATEVDGANVTLGAKADAKSTATDSTAVTIMQVLKQISASVQAPPSQAVTNAGTFAVQAASSTATGSAVPANAYYQGLLAKTSLPTAASDGNLTGAMGDKYGRAVVIPGIIRDLVGTQTTTISASTAETTIVTAAASIFNDLTALVISNTSATAVRVDIRDTTAGSVLYSLYIPAGDVRGVAFNRPIPQTSVNTNWTAQSSASVTDLRVYAVWDKNK